MNPFAIWTTLWTHKLLTIPLVLLVSGACGYALLMGPRTYESSATYVLITPGTPSAFALDNNPALAAKVDNPYLRSVDPSLAAQVAVARLGATSVGDMLKSEGLSTDYIASPATEFGSGQIIRITSSAAEATQAIATTERLGTLLSDELRSMQDVNGADEQYFMSAQVVTPAGAATERLSSRLRNVAMTAVAGLVLIFGAVSLARAVELRKDRRRAEAEAAANADSGAGDESDRNAENHDKPSGPIDLEHKPSRNGHDVLSRSNG